MTLLERHSIILELLREFGKVDVADLSSKLKVSAVTIRKDLDLLEEKKLLYRTHGGMGRSHFSRPLYCDSEGFGEGEITSGSEASDWFESGRVAFASGCFDYCIGYDGSGLCPLY